MNDNLAEKIFQNTVQAEMVCAALNRQILKLGFPPERADAAIGKRLQYHLERDPLSGRDALVGVWMHPTSGYKQGTIIFHVDDSFFAEYDVLQPHPSKRKWFVEAVTVWGKGDDIKGDPRLLAALGE